MIIRKSRRDLDRIASAGTIVAQVLSALRSAAVAGATTAQLDRIAEDLIRSEGGVPTFKGYRGFPGSICASPNDMVVHGIPGDYELDDGDVLKIDVGVTLRGWVADSALTVLVGGGNADTRRLAESCRQSLFDAIEQCVVGRHLSDLGHAVQTRVEADGYGVIRKLVGHGVGRQMHEDPQIYNYGPPGRGPLLQEGMVFAVEPMITAGSFEIELDDDQWSIYTADGSMAAHFEHTVAVTADGPRVLTRADGWSPVDDAVAA